MTEHANTMTDVARTKRALVTETGRLAESVRNILDATGYSVYNEATSDNGPWDSWIHVTEVMGHVAETLEQIGKDVLPSMLQRQAGRIYVVFLIPEHGSDCIDTEAAIAYGAALGLLQAWGHNYQDTGLSITTVSIEPETDVMQFAKTIERMLAETEDLHNMHVLVEQNKVRRQPLNVFRPAEAAQEPIPVASTADAGATVVDDGRDELRRKLGQVFRHLFELPSEVDLAGCTMANTPKWDSLGHLKLMMEIETSLEVTLSPELFSTVRDYPSLESKVLD